MAQQAASRFRYTCNPPMHVLKPNMAERDGEGEKVTKRDAAAAPVISDQEREWAQAALLDFTKGNYASCLQYLSKLEVARPQDTKVAHNKAVVEYYKSDLKKTDVFRKNMNMVCAQAHINIEDLDSLEDVEQCVIYFNQAVLLFHLKQYSSSLKIMEKVFSYIEPMEETLAHRVCLLIVELHVCTQQPQKALRLIDYIENQFVSTDNAISSDKEMKPLEREHKERKPAPVDAATDAFRLKLVQYRAKCYLMLRQLKACKRELKALITSGGMSSTAVFLKSQLEYLRGNYRKAVKVLTSLPQNSVSFKDTGDSVGVTFYNNNACIHHYMGKPYLACFYVQKALQENEGAIRSLPKPEPGEPFSARPLFTLGSNHSFELMYNLGVCLLHAGRPIQAFDCLTEAVQVYHMNSRLWLRLAECCIMAHKSGNELDFNLSKRSRDLIQGVLDMDSSTWHKKILLNPQLNSDTKYSSEGQGYAILVASVEFASLCLRNALLSLPEVPLKSAENKEAEDQTSVPAWPSTPMDAYAISSLLCSVLTASAYVSLCIGDHVMALEHAQALLLQRSLSGVHRMLGHLYASEALILRGDLDEALEHLDPVFANDLSMGLPSPDKEPDSTSEEQKPLVAWCPSNTLTAGAVLRYNMAVCLALGRNVDKAGEVLKEVWMSKNSGCDIPIHVIMLALYIEVTLRHTEIARSIIKQHVPECRYHRPPIPREDPGLSAGKLV